MKQCYLCSVNLIKNVNKSKDHVPPACIFPSGTPHRITVPCCKSCNEEYKQLDERMRNYMAGLSPLLSEPTEKGRRAVTSSAKLAREYLSHTKPHPTLVDGNGQPRLVFYFNDEELTKWLSRIVKGLYFYKNHRSICESAVFTTKVLSQIQPQPSNTFPFEKGLELRPYFVYGVVHDDNEPNTDFWVLIFYDQFVFTVTVYTP